MRNRSEISGEDKNVVEKRYQYCIMGYLTRLIYSHDPVSSQISSEKLVMESTENTDKGKRGIVVDASVRLVPPMPRSCKVSVKICVRDYGLVTVN